MEEDISASNVGLKSIDSKMDRTEDRRERNYRNDRKRRAINADANRLRHSFAIELTSRTQLRGASPDVGDRITVVDFPMACIRDCGIFIGLALVFLLAAHPPCSVRSLILFLRLSYCRTLRKREFNGGRRLSAISVRKRLEK